MHHLLADQFFAPGNLPIRVLRRNPQMPYPLHTHDFMEMVVVTGGSGIHTGDGGDIPIERGAAFVIKGEMVHGYSKLDQLCLINILFDLEKLAIPLFDLGQSPGYHRLFSIDPVTRYRNSQNPVFRLEEDELEELLELIDRMDSHIDAAGTAPGFQAITGFMQVIHLLCQAYDRRHESSTMHPHHRLGSALSYIETHLNEKITIEELTQIAGMSESSLLRAFRTITGATPIRYMQTRKIDRACWYLKHTPLSMLEIAENLGYSDSNYFSRQFHMIRGMSPRDFRRRMEHDGGSTS